MYQRMYQLRSAIEIPSSAQRHMAWAITIMFKRVAQPRARSFEDKIPDSERNAYDWSRDFSPGRQSCGSHFCHLRRPDRIASDILCCHRAAERPICGSVAKIMVDLKRTMWIVWYSIW